jgi:alkanesulfonate monooxygenase SsuD/methylene tetrahydromethanopterin reductase-like flavin-dependent oxidoreductase (luciferase family)
MVVRMERSSAGAARTARAPKISAVRLGVVIVPQHSGDEARRLWRRVEDLGFDHAWTYDHLAWRMLADEPWHAAVPTLAAAAEATEHLRLGPLVASPNFRHPVPFARELITLDDLSGGRLTLGIGSGGLGWDTTVLGGEPWSPEERADRFDEFVELTDLLLRQPSTTHEGRWYSAVEARSAPGCVQQPRIPFAVAAVGPRGMRLAARHGQAWVTIGDRHRLEPAPAEEGAPILAGQMARLDTICEEAGRDPADLDRLVLTGLTLDSGLGSAEQFADTLGRYEEVGATDLVVHWPRPTPPYEGDVATFERIFESRR